MLEAIKYDGFAFQYADDRLKQDPAFTKKSLQNCYGFNYDKMWEDIKKSKEITNSYDELEKIYKDFLTKIPNELAKDIINNKVKIIMTKIEDSKIYNDMSKNELYALLDDKSKKS